MKPLTERVRERIKCWGVVVQHSLETHGSFVAFGTRGDQPVVLKVLRRPGDEWRSGEVLAAFDGGGAVRVYEHIEGAVLLERLSPGSPLADLALQGRDEEATGVIADIIRRLSHSRGGSNRFTAVEDWGQGFQRYLESGDEQIDSRFVERGQRAYLELCASQRHVRLLHGDLQHYNILFDQQRGWVAIDPKGVVGEVEYEVGASLRNPCEKPELFASAKTVERRLKRYESELQIDIRRALGWGFAQAILSAIWDVEDGFTIEGGSPSIELATAMQGMLE